VSGPRANACAGAACCAPAVWPAAAGASGPNAGADFVALWRLGLQLLVRQDLMLALILLHSGCLACSCWCVSGPRANACAGAACCALAVWPAAAGASGPNAGAACCALAVGPAAAGACLVLMLMLLLAPPGPAAAGASGPHANACAGVACCAPAVGPAAAGACLVLVLMLVLALLVALRLLGLQLVPVHQSLVGPGSTIF
jgi:hypothetical protein